MSGHQSNLRMTRKMRKSVPYSIIDSRELDGKILKG